MQNRLQLSPNRLAWPAALFTCLVAFTTSRADDDILVPSNAPVLPKDPSLLYDNGGEPITGPSRVRLFRMQPGFLSSPVGLDNDPDTGKGAEPDADDSFNWLQVTMGNDNPYFDVRRPGDPGGVGYYKVNTQVQIFDNKSTGLSLNVQAMAPAGRESDGIQDGQKVIYPALSLFHTLDDGTAFQGFVGKNMTLNSTTPNPTLQQGLQAGVAVQHPLWLEQAERSEGFYFFVGALGRYRNPDLGVINNTVDMMPGLHWQVSPSAFMTGTIILPMAGTPTTTTNNTMQQWQLTLSWQF